VTDGVEDLYDYDVLRRQVDATMFIIRLAEPTLVLGGNQSRDVLNADRVRSLALRRRKGGGGLVLLQPDDLWVDWWIPGNDPRWSSDVRRNAITAGHWWHDVLVSTISGEVSVHEGPLVGEPVHRVVCFAGRGPGEIFVAGRKAVGVTQWRVREGVFLSSVLHAEGSSDVISLLAEVPEGLAMALDHHTISSLGIDDPEALVADLAGHSGPWTVRHLFLTA
jgi:lipoate-protein ligase A